MRLSLIAMLVLLSGALAHAELWPWGCVVYASHGQPEPCHHLAPYEKDLRSTFGYERMEVIGTAWAYGPATEQTWISPTRDFFLKVDPDGQAAAKNAVQIELFQREKSLVKAKAKLNGKTPVFIKGPEYKQGQLIVILHLKDTASSPTYFR